MLPPSAMNWWHPGDLRFPVGSLSTTVRVLRSARSPYQLCRSPTCRWLYARQQAWRHEPTHPSGVHVFPSLVTPRGSFGAAVICWSNWSWISRAMRQRLTPTGFSTSCTESYAD